MLLLLKLETNLRDIGLEMIIVTLYVVALGGFNEDTTCYHTQEKRKH